jgi:inosine/xanthosine triphosphate pyrophosphatase family protein
VPAPEPGRGRIAACARPIVFVTSREEKAREAERLGFEIERLDLDLPEAAGARPVGDRRGQGAGGVRRDRASGARRRQRPAIRAWGGFPGRSVKWLEKSAGVPAIPAMLDERSGDRSAAAVCAIGYCDRRRGRHGARRFRRDRRQRRGAGGPDGTRSVPEGGDRTFAEMAPEEKDRISTGGARGTRWRPGFRCRGAPERAGARRRGTCGGHAFGDGLRRSSTS